MTSNNENIQSLIKTYMKHVSSCLRQHYPNTYEQFLRSMFDLNEDKIGASQCLEQIRLSLCEFPPLIDQFERLYNTLVNSNVGKNDDYDKKRKIPAIDCTQENNAENTLIPQLLTNKHGAGTNISMQRLIKSIQMDQAN